MDFSQYPAHANNAFAVYFVSNNFGTADSFSASVYMGSTVKNTHVHYLPVEYFNMSSVNASDVIISVGGPLVNPITAMYENVSKAHMIISGKNITVVTPTGDYNWSAPATWYNVTEGYFIISIFRDSETGAIVVTVYGTDASSTAAGAYYFANVIYPNIADYSGISCIVGKWVNTNNATTPVFIYPGTNIPLNFDPNDEITVLYQG